MELSRSKKFIEHVIDIKWGLVTRASHSHVVAGKRVWAGG